MKCQICQGNRWNRRYATVDYLTGHGFDIMICRACGMASTWPVPEDMRPYYTTEYYGDSMQRFPGPMEAMVRWFRADRARRVERLARWLGKLPDEPAILDIGCGRGVMLGVLRHQGWQTFGCELSVDSAEAARRGGSDVRSEPMQTDMFAAESFDVITLWHSLEHLMEPAATIRYCQRWLKPGGVLLVAVPDFGSWQAHFGGPVWFHLDPPRHLHHFNRRLLRRLLEESGFRTVRWDFFSLEYDIYSWMQTLLNRVGFPNGLLYRLLHVRSAMSPAERRWALATLAAAVPCTLLGLMLTLLGWLLQNGSTMEVCATRSA